MIIRDQYWPVKRSIGTGPDHGCVCPSPASEHRVQRGSNMDQMEADSANTDTSLQMLMMLQQMRDKIDRQISVKHGRDITTPAGFSRLSPFRPSGKVHNNISFLFKYCVRKHPTMERNHEKYWLIERENYLPFTAGMK